METGLQPNERCNNAGISSTVVDNEPSSARHVAQQGLDHRPILFFDGVCGLCNHTIDFIIRHDRRRVFRYAPLQGTTAKRLLDPAVIQQLKTFVFLGEKREYRRSAAIVRMLWRLGGIWKILGGLLWLIPLPIRDVGYRCVSATRYRLFGKKEVCRIPAPEERVLFLE